MRQQRAVRRGCVPYQQHLVHRARLRRVPDKPALVKQMLCSARRAQVGGEMGKNRRTAPVPVSTPDTEHSRGSCAPRPAGRRRHCLGLLGRQLMALGERLDVKAGGTVRGPTARCLGRRRRALVCGPPPMHVGPLLSRQTVVRRLNALTIRLRLSVIFPCVCVPRGGFCLACSPWGAGARSRVARGVKPTIVCAPRVMQVAQGWEAAGSGGGGR